MRRPLIPARLAAVAALSIGGGVVLPTTTRAQATARTGAPVSGTWGAEAGLGRFSDASVLRFLSPSWAVLVGGSISRTSGVGLGNSSGDGRTTAVLQAGVRKYHRTELGLRPVTGFGVTLGRFSSEINTGGIYGEAGAEYLFTPHLSVGAVGVARFSRDGDQNTVSLLVPRLFAAVFF